MPRIFALAASFVLACALSMPAHAQSNQRTSYNDELAILTELISAGQLGSAIARLRPDAGLTEPEIEKLNAELTGLYEGGFTGSAPVRSETLKGGFRQEMVSFWTDKGEYFYVYMLLHAPSRGGDRLVLSLVYDTDFQKIYDLF